MSVRRKNTEFVVPSESLENRRFSCILKNNVVQLTSFSAPSISLLNGYGYGKGTLSRNMPDHSARLVSGLSRVAVGDPFAPPKRLASAAQSSSSVDQVTNDLASLDLRESSSPEEYQLGWEEAMYLEAQMSAISICLSDSQSPLETLDLFEHFMKLDENFDIRYYVYKHFRQAGWVVKLGTKVGVDFLLYPLGGPQQAHAQYGVSIQKHKSSSAAVHSISWPASARVLDSVAKSLLIAMVTPGDSHRVEGSQQIIPDFADWQLHELVLARWQSSDSTKTS